MPVKVFDPNKFIDRKFEQELFERLLQFESPASRVLAVRDNGGMGKTQLLEKLSYRCRTVQPRTPVSLISLKDMQTGQPLELVRELARELRDDFDVPFPTFDPLDEALDNGDFAAVQPRINLQGADLSNAQVRLAELNAEKFVIHGNPVFNLADRPPVPVSPRQLATMQSACLLAFLEDLRQFCTEHTVVLMLDHFEECGEELERWIRRPFLTRYFFDASNRPERLVFVVAGREVPPFETNWSEDEINAVVRSVRGLGKWARHDIEECLKVYGYHYDDRALDMFVSMVEMGSTPATVVSFIEVGATPETILGVLASAARGLVP